MACFIVPTTEAIVTTIAAKCVKKHEAAAPAGDTAAILFSEKLGWLNKLLWGGSALLAFEHIWHGEVTPFFPFLTAAADAADRAEMFREMATSGVAMALLVTAVWGCMCAVVSRMQKRKKTALPLHAEAQS
ncbi:MAG: hypothetical protein IKI45_15380 [Oscillospiraceae bacterium]|nr:hypothetical protein [Oscillospiraceae bacterium]